MTLKRRLVVTQASRSLEVTPFNKSHTTSQSHSIVTWC